MPLGLELSFLKKASYFVRNVEKKVSHSVIGAFVVQTTPDSVIGVLTEVTIHDTLTTKD